MSQKSSLIEESSKPADDFIREGRQHKIVNMISAPHLKCVDVKLPVSENNITFERDSSLDRREVSIPASRVATSPKLHSNMLSVHFPSVIKTKAMAARKQTFDIFFNKNRYEDPRDKISGNWDFHTIKKNASLEHIQQLSNVARKRSLNKTKSRSGVMYINELWDDRYYKNMLKKSGIQSYKDKMEKIIRASLLERKQLSIEKAERAPLVSSENNIAIRAKPDIFTNPEINIRGFFLGSRRPSIEEKMEQPDLNKKASNEVCSWSEQNNTSICFPQDQKYYFSLAERGLVNSRTKEEDFSRQDMVKRTGNVNITENTQLFLSRELPEKSHAKSEVSTTVIESRNHNKENQEPFRPIAYNNSTPIQNNRRARQKGVNERLYPAFKDISVSYDSLNVRKPPKYKEKDLQESRKLRENIGKIIYNCKELDDGGLLQK